ncbi:MAG: J domain-containing protein [Microthrixaceae bacterium]|nr:J domain-containing protein [Microthrixaceae bacterium]
MVLAELNAYVSRPIAPTRRIALGESKLPCGPGPGMGGVLLGAIIATYSSSLDDDTQVDLDQLITEVDHGRRIPQPRMRHRFQVDHIGLQRISYKLLSAGEQMSFHFESEKATPAQHVLTAVYSAGAIENEARHVVMRMMRRAMGFPGGTDSDLLRFLTGNARSGLHVFSDPVTWALDVLKLTPAMDHQRFDSTKSNAKDRRAGVASLPAAPTMELPSALPKLPNRSEIQRAFRRQLRHSHPDHGADRVGAAQRIADLAEARRILLER